MILVDVNILVFAHREEMPSHDRYREWVDRLSAAPEAFGMSDLVLSSFVRIVTNPKAFRDPTPPVRALAFADALRSRPNCVRIAPGPRHWQIFADLCRGPNVRGPLVPDAWLAALAIESGSELVTDDGDFASFPGLRWRRPFDERVSERGVRYGRSRSRRPSHRNERARE